MSDTKELIERLQAFVALDGGDLAVVEQAADTIARLEAERDAARADAERYRWLRSRFDELRDGWALEVCVDGAPSLETLEDAIDAAMGKQQ